MKLAKFFALILALALFLPSCSAGLVMEEEETKEETETFVQEETKEVETEPEIKKTEEKTFLDGLVDAMQGRVETERGREYYAPFRL